MSAILFYKEVTLTRKEIREQLKTALEAEESTINFPADTSLVLINKVIKRFTRMGKFNVLKVTVQAGSSPNFDIVYKS